MFTWDGGTPRHNLILCGRGKKNYKSTDLILAALYRFLVWTSAFGNDCFLLANDEGQAADDLVLAKKLVKANPILEDDVEVRAKELVRRDGAGALQILPARDVAGAHGKTYLFVGFDEIHAYRTWDLFEALAPDPTRPDALTWITSYASIFNVQAFQARAVRRIRAGVECKRDRATGPAEATGTTRGFGLAWHQDRSPAERTRRLGERCCWRCLVGVETERRTPHLGLAVCGPG